MGDEVAAFPRPRDPAPIGYALGGGEWHLVVDEVFYFGCVPGAGHWTWRAACGRSGPGYSAPEKVRPLRVCERCKAEVARA